MQKFYQNVQMAGTACLFNLTRNELVAKVPNYLKIELIKLMLSIMEIFPNSLNVNLKLE